MAFKVCQKQAGMLNQDYKRFWEIKGISTGCKGILKCFRGSQESFIRVFQGSWRLRNFQRGLWLFRTSFGKFKWRFQRGFRGTSGSFSRILGFQRDFKLVSRCFRNIQEVYQQILETSERWFQRNVLGFHKGFMEFQGSFQSGFRIMQEISADYRLFNDVSGDFNLILWFFRSIEECLSLEASKSPKGFQTSFKKFQVCYQRGFRGMSRSFSGIHESFRILQRNYKVCYEYSGQLQPDVTRFLRVEGGFW